MWKTEFGDMRSGRVHGRPARLQRMAGPGSRSARLLHGCPVMTADGTDLGEVDHLMVDASTQQLRYVMLRGVEGGATIAIPWRSLYFDGALGRLVFYSVD